ncbi:hypothetical protein ACJ73_05544 [Blastomyces percursus]|uniref:Uncharacterized protein n=1 Tax=Blastomyces percursus TaxID=1658174 RepID=A0A1J9R638_9EURO|nr:hypothetical protein ACJ73_05544 [Blastomyces percursus]
MDGATMFPNKQFSQPTHTLHGDMGNAPWAWPGIQHVNHQTPHNGYHQVPQPHFEANSRPVHPGISPHQHAFANQVNIMPGVELQNGNTITAPIPHAAGPNHAQMHMQAHHRFQNKNPYRQSFQSRNSGFRSQHPAPNSNGPVPNNNGNGNGSRHHRQRSSTHRNEGFNVPGQKGHSNMMMARQNGVSRSSDGMGSLVPPQMQGTHHNEFFSVSNHIGQNNNMISNQNRVAQPPHEVNPGTSPQNQGSQQSSPFHEPNHPGQNNNEAAHHQMNPRAPPYIPGTHHNESFNEPNHPGQSNVTAIQPSGMNPAHLLPRLSPPHPSAPHHHPVRDGLNVPPHSEFNGAQQANVGHPNPESNNMHHPGVHHPNQAGSLEGSQRGAVIIHPHGPPQPPQEDALAPDPAVVNPSIPGYHPDVHAWPNNSHAPASVAQAPRRFSDSGTLHPHPSNAGFTMPPCSNGMGTVVQAPNAVGQSTPPNANPPLPQDGQFNHPFNGGTQAANDQNSGNMGNPDVFHLGSQGFPNGMAQNPVPAPQPLNSNSGQNTNQNNHGFQNGVVHHPVPASEPSNSNAAQRVNQNNHGFQNGMVHPVHHAPQLSDANAVQHMNQHNHSFQDGVAHVPAVGAQLNGNSHVAHAEGPYTGYYANIEAGANSAAHKEGAGEVTGQYPALYPGTTVVLNQQVHAQRFELHPAQYHDLRYLQIPNSQIMHGVGVHPQPIMVQPSMPRYNFPLDPAVKLWKMRQDRRRENSKKRAQPGKPKGKRRSIGTTSNQPPLHLQPNGHLIVPTSAETSAGVPPAPQDNVYPAPYANNRENREYIDPGEIQCGNGGVPPDPAVFQEPEKPAGVPTINGVSPSVPAASATDMETAPNMNGNSENKEFGGLTVHEAEMNKTLRSIFLEFYDPKCIDDQSDVGQPYAEKMDHDNTLGDFGQIPAPTGLSPIQPNANQLTTKAFDESMQMIELIGHKNTPGYPVQLPSSAGPRAAQPNVGQPAQEEMQVDHENTPGGPAQAQPNASQFRVEDFVETMARMRDDDDGNPV